MENLEIKDLFTVLGYTGEADLEAFKTFAHKELIHRSEAHKDKELEAKMTGKRIGDILTSYAKLTGRKHSEIADANVEELFAEDREQLMQQIEEAKAKSKEGKDKQLIDLQEQLEEKDKSILNYKEANETLLGQVETLNNDMSSFKKDTTISSQFAEIQRKFTLKDGITEVEKVGFDTMFNNKYKLDLDSDKLDIKDSDGNPVKSETAGKFATVEEVYKKELLDNKLLKVNNADTGKGPGIPGTPGANGQQTKNTGIFREAVL